MATLPGGPNYAQQTVLTASAKELVVTTTNSNYQRIGWVGGREFRRALPAMRIGRRFVIEIRHES